MDKRKEHVAVIGLGYVGLPLALLASKKGYKTYGIDIDTQKVNKINNKISPFFDDEIQKELEKCNFIATTEFNIIKDCDISIICVPTPVNADKTPNLKPIKEACTSISKYIKKGSLVILESTVNPGVCENVIIPLLEENSGLKAGVDFYIAHCPERINPGDKKWNVENINRVVGSLEKTGLDMVYDFYSSIITGNIHKMSNLKEAEAVKVIENSFRDINIAFINEIAMSFSLLGIDVVNVIEGAKTKPFSFLAHYPGCGVGGHCIPVDPYYLIEYAKKESGFEHAFLSLARNINNNMPKFTVDLLTNAIKEKGLFPKDFKITILGIAYKANIGDFRESPSFAIIEEAEKQGYIVSSFDPFVLEKSTHKTLNEALEGSKAVIIATNHTLFKNLTPDFFIEKNISFIIDGRNCLDKEKFINTNIVYKGIGR